MMCFQSVGSAFCFPFLSFFVLSYEITPLPPSLPQQKGWVLDLAKKYYGGRDKTIFFFFEIKKEREIA